MKLQALGEVVALPQDQYLQTMDPEKMKLSELLYEAADQLAYDGDLWNILHRKALDLERRVEESEAHKT